MSLTYTTYVNTLAQMLVVPSGDPRFVAVLPSIIDDAEQRIYRELDLLAERVSDVGNATPNSRGFTLPTLFGKFVVVEEVLVGTPAGTANNTTPLTAVSSECLHALFTDYTPAASGVPRYWSPFNSTIIQIVPAPDQAYFITVIGTQRPAPLSASNTTTVLSTMLPDLFMAASLVFGAGYQKNFGAMSDDPRAAQSWEAHYQSLKQSAQVEEMRKKLTSQGWSSKEPAPLATPPRN
jgi:hypothetical protein